MKRMSPADAALWLAEYDEDKWEMPEDYWCVETVNSRYEVEEQIARQLLVEPRALLHSASSEFYQFLDIYGAAVHIRVGAITDIYQSSKLIRARWIAGMLVRNYKPEFEDEQPEKPWE